MKPARIASALMLAPLVVAAPALAQEAEVYGPPDAASSASDGAGDPAARKAPLFPIWGDKARERGIELLPAFGMAGMTINNRQELDAANLAVNIVKGDTIADDVTLFDLPFVTPYDLKSDTFNSQFKADLWVFPFLDVFAAIGKAKGDLDVTVDIDLDAFVPFPFCRPAKPCGIATLPFRATVDNTTVTVGAVAAYGSERWFASATAARTVSMSSKDRSDIQTTDLGVRGGPRIKLGGNVTFSPYVGADYFDMDVDVNGVVRSGPLFEDGDPISMRYSISLSPRKPWAGIGGGLLQIGRHWMVQGEYNLGAASNRFMVSLTVRP